MCHVYECTTRFKYVWGGLKLTTWPIKETWFVSLENKGIRRFSMDNLACRKGKDDRRLNAWYYHSQWTMGYQVRNLHKQGKVKSLCLWYFSCDWKKETNTIVIIENKPNCQKKGLSMIRRYNHIEYDCVKMVSWKVASHFWSNTALMVYVETFY